MADFTALLLPALFAAMGLHLPKAFSLYYAGLFLLAWRGRRQPMPSPLIRCSSLLLLAFGVSYAAISVHYGFWRLDGRDLLDLVSVLVLPALGVWLGALAGARLGWRGMGWLWLAYGLGALVFAWLVLLHGRVWCDGGGWSQLWELRRSSSISVPWGPDLVVNVRSIEQNASIAVTWLIPGLWLTRSPRHCPVGCFMLLAAIAGLGAVACFHGRLGYLMAMVGALPLLALLSLSQRIRRWLVVVSAGCMAALSAAIASRQLKASDLLRRVYDERFDRFAGFFPAAPEFPWGGNQIHFEAFDRMRGGLLYFDSRQGDLMHNVPLDVYVRVGWLPVLFLLLAVIPLLLEAFKAVSVGMRMPADQPAVLLASSLALCLTVQWLFQPLIFGDGLFFYLGFVLLGFLASRPHELQP